MSLLRVAFRQKIVATFAYSVGGLASIWLYVAIYPSLAAQAQQLNKLYESFPPAIMKLFGAANIGLTNFEGLLGIKQYGLVWPLLLLFLVTAIAGSAFAGEIEKTTIGLWLVAPVSRLRIYISKYLAGILAMIIFIIFSVLSVIPLAALYHVQVTNSHIYWLSIIGGLFGLAVYGLAVLCSSLFSEKGKVYAVIGGLMLVMYIMNITAELYPKLDWLRYGSFFYYYNVNDLLTNGQVNSASFAVFGLVAVAGALLGAWIFNRRDVSI